MKKTNKLLAIALLAITAFSSCEKTEMLNELNGTWKKESAVIINECKQSELSTQWNLIKFEKDGSVYFNGEKSAYKYQLYDRTIKFLNNENSMELRYLQENANHLQLDIRETSGCVFKVTYKRDN